MFKISLLFIVLAISSLKITVADDWWEYGHFYQIYPRSFKDSSADGIGDLNGITEKLSYFNTIGVTGVWLSPIFASPMKDFGYDISDFEAIQTEYGTMDDFEKMAAKCKELGIKLILDFVPNHTSDQHTWFQKSSNPKDPEYEKYKNYYIWNSGTLLENGTRLPPSNWLSVFRGSAWTWNEARGEYYYHQFLPEQPDLNLYNEYVLAELKEVMRFWFRKGVNGFRIDAMPFLFEAKQNANGLYNDEPESGWSTDPEDYSYLNHIYTYDLDETFDWTYDFRQVAEEDEFKNNTRVLMTEAYSSLENTMRYYGKVENDEIVKYGAQIPFNFYMIWTDASTNASVLAYLIKDFIDHLPKGNQIHANWVLGNHDRRRIASRYSPTRTDLFNILLKTLPGITITYYGEEIGMTDQYLSWAHTVDPQACRTNETVYEQFSRDPARTPMQWTNGTSAGFSTNATTWLPVAENYTACNVENQNEQDVSHLKVFKSLASLRENPTIKYGGFDMKVVNNDVIVYKRQARQDYNASDVIVVLLNLGTKVQIVTLDTVFSELPQNMTVVTSSIQSTLLLAGDVVQTRTIVIEPEVGVVLSAKDEQRNSGTGLTNTAVSICFCLFILTLVQDIVI